MYYVGRFTRHWTFAQVIHTIGEQCCGGKMPRVKTIGDCLNIQDLELIFHNQNVCRPKPGPLYLINAYYKIFQFEHSSVKTCF